MLAIGPNSALSVRLWLLCYGGSSERLLKWAIGVELETANSKCCLVFMTTVPWPLYKRVWHFIPLQTSTLALLLIKKIIEIWHFHILPTLDLGRHQKFERLLIVLGHRTMTGVPRCMTFHMFKEKWSCFIPNSRNFPQIHLILCRFYSLLK